MSLMFTSNKVPVEYLHRVMTCDAERGLLFWKERPIEMFAAYPDADFRCSGWNTRWAGKPAMLVLSGKYYSGGLVIDGRRHGFRTHRVVWAMSKGSWPDQELDHINRDTTDNRISNLRECSRTENCFNIAPVQARGAVSSAKGVGLHRGKWRARISVECKSRHIGYFDTELEAIKAYNAEAAARGGAFAYVNAIGDA